MGRFYVPVGANYSESIEKMATAVPCSTEYLVSEFVEEFLLRGRSGFLVPSLAPSTRGHNVSMTQEVLEKLAQFKEEEGHPESDLVILRAIIENRVRDRRREGHQAASVET